MNQNDVYVNFYRNPGDEVTTSSVHKSRELADDAGKKVGGLISKKKWVARIRVQAVCIDGQFDN